MNLSICQFWENLAEKVIFHFRVVHKLTIRRVTLAFVESAEHYPRFAGTVFVVCDVIFLAAEFKLIRFFCLQQEKELVTRHKATSLV